MCAELLKPGVTRISFPVVLFSYHITHQGKLLDSDWLSYEFIHNLRANSVIRGKLQIFLKCKSVIHSECKYAKELTVND